MHMHLLIVSPVNIRDVSPVNIRDVIRDVNEYIALKQLAAFFILNYTIYMTVQGYHSISGTYHNIH